MSGSHTSIPTDDGAMPALRWPAPDAPAIVLFQEIFGVNDYIKGRAEDLHALGCDVLVPEVYWRLADATVDESAPDFLEQAGDLLGRLDWERAVSDCAAAVGQAQQAHRTVGLVGFCFGGGLGFNVAAVTVPDALVSYYGSALPSLLHLAPRVTAPSLHIFGEADDYLPMETVETIRAAVEAQGGVEFHTFPGANHAFDNPRPEFHHPEASRRAWELTVDFLGRHLPIS